MKNINGNKAEMGGFWAEVTPGSKAEMGGFWAELKGGNETLYKYRYLLPHFRTSPDSISAINHLPA